MTKIHYPSVVSRNRLPTWVSVLVLLCAVGLLVLFARDVYGDEGEHSRVTEGQKVSR